MSAPAFIHLRVHSDFSMVDGLAKIKPLLAAAKADEMPALALTDQMNLCGWVRFYSQAQQLGIKPLIGSDIWVQHTPHEPPFRLVLLAQNQQGYRHLTTLISNAYLRGHVEGKPVIDKAWLAEYNDGLIVLSGAREGDIGQALLKGNHALVAQYVEFYQRYFPDRFYLELQRTGRPQDEYYVQQAIDLSQSTQLPVVATNEVVFLTAEDFTAHDVRVAINEGYTLDDPRRPQRYSAEQHFKTSTQMQALFADIPEALHNSVEIAKRCSVTLRLGEYFLPDFPTQGIPVTTYLVQQAQAGLEVRLKQLFPDATERTAQRPAYDERLAIELDVINNMGFPGYFLIVMEFIQWSKDNGIPVGPGRGSGAGSLVAYALQITDLDPLALDLLFERFLNPERVSMPDFDIDFCMDRRDEVIEHVAELYGRNAVSQIITFGSLAAKAAIRDVGRVLGHPYGFVDRISKLIPLDPGMTLAKAFEQEPKLPELYAQDEEVKALIDMARSLEGVIRNAGKHAGGVVIAPTQITDFSPLYCDAHGEHPVTQFDKNDVEYAGLVKFDFLGLRTLTIIDWALEMINSRITATGQAPIDISTIPLDDKKAFALLQQADTTAVFQLESRGMKDLIKRLRPDCFEDMIALVALFRPGPLQSGMVDNFIDRKHGREIISYPDINWQHDSLKATLEPTYGIILYQEQVMQIAQVLSGYSLGQADLLRRAMGKKNADEMAQQRAIFAAGAEKNGINPDLAMKIFDLVEKFAGYGFNKSHSAAYALVSYQTLWLKTHYPAEFMAAVMSADMDNTDKIVTLVEEAKRLGLTVVPPNVNQGYYRFSVNEQGEIVYGLGAIKGVGEAPIAAMVAARATALFQDLFDFCSRIDTKHLNKRVMEKLILSGALDALGLHRAALMANMDNAIKAAGQQAKALAIGQGDMFGVLAAPQSGTTAELVSSAPWPQKVILEGEKATLGLYLSGHPLDEYRTELMHYTQGKTLADLQPSERYDKDRTAMAGGWVLGIRTMMTKTGQKLGFVTLEDQHTRMDVKLFDTDLERYADILQPDSILLIKGTVTLDNYSGELRMSAKEIQTLEQIRIQQLQALCLHLTHDNITALQPLLYDTLNAAQGGHCPLLIRYQRHDITAIYKAGTPWYIHPTNALLDNLRALLGGKGVSLEFNPHAV